MTAQPNDATFESLLKVERAARQRAEEEITRLHREFDDRLAERIDVLQDGESLCYTLFEGTDCGIALYDTETGRCVACNKAACQLIGAATEEQFRKLHPLDFAPPEQPNGRTSADEHHAYREATLCDGQAQFEWLYRRLDGVERFAQVNLTHFELNSRQLNLMVWMDITATKAAERALQESEAKFRRLVEDLHEDYAIYSHTPDGVFTYISSSSQKVLGAARHKRLGRNWREFIDPESVSYQTALRADQLCREGKTPEPYELKFNAADGKQKITEIHQRPVKDEYGNVVAIEGIGKDVTRQKQMEIALREAHDHLEQRVIERTAELREANETLQRERTLYRSVVETQTEFVVRWLPDEILTFVNDAYCRFFGRSREELIGHSLLPRIAEDDRESFLRRIQSITPEHPIVAYEERVYRPDGSISWQEWIDHGIFDTSGQLIEYQSVGRDIDPLKRSQAQLRETERELAHVARLAAMGETVAGIAHELNQPLHAASTFAAAARAVMANDPSEGGQRIEELCSKVQAQIDRAAEIIRRLREFTKQRPVEPERLQLNPVIQESIVLVAHESRQQGVEIQFDLTSPSPYIIADRVQLEQVLTNLLFNALDSLNETPRQERFLLVSTRLGDDTVIVSVRDNGCGMTPDQINHVFEPFHTSKKNGMGIGLAVAKKIIESHNGKIWVEENKDPGTTFSFSLPIAKGGADG